MNKALTNVSGLSTCMAVWLAHDTYTDGGDQFPGKDVISATGLLKGTRQMILSNRVDPADRVVDVTELIASRLGSAIHDSIETAWVEGHASAMARLGYPKKVIDNVRINPTDDELFDGCIPVYLEQRYFRELDKNIIISGKFDQIFNGELNDTKSTSVYAYINGSKEEDYMIQGSIYRWINPDKVTSDVMRIQHVFTDWQRFMAKADPQNYPQSRVLEFKVQLMGLKETENWMRLKVREILANQHLPEPEIVRCTSKELWMSDPVFKYYSDPQKAAAGGRATKNFPNYPAAATYRNEKGKGVVVTVQAEPKACAYCGGADLCSQRKEYFPDD